MQGIPATLNSFHGLTAEEVLGSGQPAGTINPPQSQSRAGWQKPVSQQGSVVPHNSIQQAVGKRQPPTAIYSKARLSQVGGEQCPRLLELQLYVEGRPEPYKAMIDSGATCSFVRRSAIDGLDITPSKAAPLLVTLADNTEHTCEEEVLLPFFYTSDHKHQQAVKLRVLDSLTYDIVLGMDWLRECNPQINWIDYTVSIPLTEGQQLVLDANAVAGTFRIELCTISHAMRAVKSQKAVAWFGLVREAKSTETETDPHASVDSRFESLCNEFADIFAEPGMPPHRPLNHRIDLVDDTLPPPKPRQYRLSPPELEEVTKQVSKMVDKGWVRPSVSPYGAPILFVRKKTGELRMCIDFRMLNRNTTIDVFPIPRIADLLDKLSKATVYSTIDLAAAYHQVRIEPGHEHRTAFLTPDGLYEFTVLPFGLCNAPATFQRLMNTTFREFLGQFVLVYLDDILVFSNTLEEHFVHLRKVFERLRRDKYFAKRQKCEFGKASVQYLGHVISQGGVSVDTSKTDAIRLWPTPTCQRELQQFLGLANYYNAFIRDFATIAAPLTELLGKKVDWQWREAQQHAFNELRDKLCTTPVLRLPDFDREFIVETDASDVATGAVLLQEYKDGYHPVAYYSRKYTSAESNYSTYDKELLAIYRACTKWRCYLDMKRTIVYTDHQPLTYISTSSHPSRRAAEWIDKLSELALDIRHKPGALNVVADTLSRKPVQQQSRLSEDDERMFGQWLKGVAPHLDPLAAADAAYKSLQAGRALLFIKCAHCSAAHLDRDDFATRLHTVHTCKTCGKNWKHEGEQVQGNPLAAWAPKLHGNTLVLTSQPAKLNTLVVEPSFLQNVYRGQQDVGDQQMGQLQTRARGQDSQWVIRSVHGMELVYRVGKGGVMQLLIPGSFGLRQLLIEELHSSAYMGHLGVRKTCAALKQRVFWPSLERDVKRFVRGCTTCQRTKDPTTRPGGLLAPLPVPEGKFSQWSMDFVTDLPMERGYNGLLTIVDKFSKYTRLIPITIGDGQLSAPEVARVFFDNIVRQYGIPHSVLHDRDPRFTSTFWQALWRILGTRTVFSSAFHPQTDGQTERQHRTIEQIIRAHVLEYPHTCWVDALGLTELAINSTVADSTGMTPSMVLYGQDMRLPVDVLDGMHPNDAAQTATRDFAAITATARTRLLAAQQYQKQYADRRRVARAFAEGDHVWLSSRNIRLVGSKKLLPRFLGPFEVVGKVGEQAYRLKLTGRLVDLHPVFHVSLLKSFEDNGLGQPPPAIELAGGEEEFEVENIIGHRMRRGNREFLVRWRGYDASEDLWLSAEELGNAAEVLSRYKQSAGLD